MSKQKPVHLLLALVLLLLLIVGNITAVGATGSTAPKQPTPTPSGPTPTPPPVPAGMRAGLRASNYGISPWPSPTWWVNSINSMKSRWPGSTGEQVAVVVEVSGGGGRGKCWAHFPQPATGTWPNVNWDSVDLFEPAFDAFDTNGIKVWLQVEPATCDVPMLIDLMMLQYGHHPSVLGFGVDVEWYRKDLAQYGKPVTDAEAQAWVQKTQTYNPTYLVFLKHWLTEKMPPTYRTGLVFIDDSQGHGSLNAMVTEFSNWGQTFAPSPVGFQYGYQSDKSWWSGLPDPPKTIGNALLANIPNTRDLVWVDFTAYDIWPPQ